VLEAHGHGRRDAEAVVTGKIRLILCGENAHFLLIISVVFVHIQRGS
jgi:hypothetical protein